MLAKAVKGLRKQNAEYEARIKGFEEQTADLAQLRDDLDKAQNLSQRESAQKTKAENLVASLKSEILKRDQAHSIAIQEADLRSKEIRDQVSQLQTQLEEQKTNAREIESQLGRAQENLAKKIAELKTLQEELASVQKTAADQDTRSELQSVAQVADLEKRLAETSAQLQESDANFASIFAQQDQQDTLIADLQRENKVMSEKIQASEAQLVEKETKLASLTDSDGKFRDASQKELSILQNELKETCAKYALLEVERDAKIRDVLRLQASIKQKDEAHAETLAQKDLVLMPLGTRGSDNQKIISTSSPRSKTGQRSPQSRTRHQSKDAQKLLRAGVESRAQAMHSQVKLILLINSKAESQSNLDNVQDHLQDASQEEIFELDSGSNLENESKAFKSMQAVQSTNQMPADTKLVQVKLIVQSSRSASIKKKESSPYSITTIIESADSGSVSGSGSGRESSLQSYSTTSKSSEISFSDELKRSPPEQMSFPDPVSVERVAALMRRNSMSLQNTLSTVPEEEYSPQHPFNRRIKLGSRKGSQQLPSRATVHIERQASLPIPRTKGHTRRRSSQGIEVFKNDWPSRRASISAGQSLSLSSKGLSLGSDSAHGDLAELSKRVTSIDTRANLGALPLQSLECSSPRFSFSSENGDSSEHVQKGPDVELRTLKSAHGIDRALLRAQFKYASQLVSRSLPLETTEILRDPSLPYSDDQKFHVAANLPKFKRAPSILLDQTLIFQNESSRLLTEAITPATGKPSLIICTTLESLAQILN